MSFGSRDFLKDLLKYLPAQLIPGLVGFLSVPIITRLFAPDDYGRYGLALITVSVVTILFDWLPLSINRFHSKFEVELRIDWFYGNIVKLNIIATIFGIIASTLVLVGYQFIIDSNGLEFTDSDHKLVVLLKWGIGLFCVTSIFNVLKQLLRMQRKVGWYSAVDMWVRIMTVVIGILLVTTFNWNVEGLIAGGIISIAVAIPVAWSRAINGRNIIGYSIDAKLVKSMALFSLPLVAGNLAAWVLSLSSRYVIALFRGPFEVGIYTACYIIADRTIMLLVNMFSFAEGPISYLLWEKEGEQQSRIFRRQMCRFFLIGITPVAVLLSCSASLVMKVMAGSKYQEGYHIIPFVVFGVFLNGLQQLYLPGFTLKKKTGLIPVAVVAAGGLNIILNIVFVPRFGYLAAAQATFVAYAFLAALIIVLSRRYFIWPFPFPTLLRVGIACSVMSIVVILTKYYLPGTTLLKLSVCVMGGFIIYIFLLFLFHEITPLEIQQIATLRRRLFSRSS